MDELVREVNRPQRGQQPPHLAGELARRPEQRARIMLAPCHLIAGALRSPATELSQLRRGHAQVGLPLGVAVELGADQAPVGAFRDSGGDGESPAELG